ncbi:hypothetical protein BJF90_13470 [Pseudonocardia sp. CNS-004]|nr:hypothetical protein BJF90_13470 [Pseudonocardia sp. CNS-004]
MSRSPRTKPEVRERVVLRCSGPAIIAIRRWPCDARCSTSAAAPVSSSPVIESTWSSLDRRAYSTTGRRGLASRTTADPAALHGTCAIPSTRCSTSERSSSASASGSLPLQQSSNR